MFTTSTDEVHKQRIPFSHNIKENGKQISSFNDIIQNDAFDHITRNILSNCDPFTIECCRIACKSLNKVIMEDGKSLDKIIKRIRFIRCLVHPEFKQVIRKIEIGGSYSQKMKLGRLLINFCQDEDLKIQTPMGFNMIEMSNFFLGKSIFFYLLK